MRLTTGTRVGSSSVEDARARAVADMAGRMVQKVEGKVVVGASANSEQAKASAAQAAQKTEEEARQAEARQAETMELRRELAQMQAKLEQAEGRQSSPASGVQEKTEGAREDARKQEVLARTVPDGQQGGAR